MEPLLQKLSLTARKAAQSYDWNTTLKIALQILNNDPHESEGFFLKGLAEKALSKPDDAITSFSESLKKNNERYDAAIELSSLLTTNLQCYRAAELLTTYTKLLTNSPRYLDLAATVYMEIGMPEEAWPLYQRANTLQPNIPLFQANLANCAAHLGKIDTARKTYKELLNRNPDHQRNHYHLSRLEKATNSLHVDDMRASIKRTRLPPHRNIFINYAIGKELEDLERWREAFDYYKSAGDAAASISRYNVDTDIETIETVIATFNKNWMDSTPENIREPKNNKTPIFIVGLPRTGSTLVERILASHSKIDSLGETPFLPSSVQEAAGFQPTGQISSEVLKAASDVVTKDVASLYMKNIQYRKLKSSFFIEKLPYNFLLLAFIVKAFPNAKIIQTVRNPVDTCFSIYKQLFTWAYQFSYRLEDLASYYIFHEKLSRHWDKLLGDRIIKIEYESLVLNQQKETSRLLARLGLNMENSCLNFHTNKSASMTASSIQIRKQINSNSLNKWKKFEPQLTPLIHKLRAAKLI
ncbi:tetratricopeptide repeat-containing sulfotransferase family protein [Microbulbifer sp. EKSA005]|uniref:tetratricopeptide repeat-containing sulfotransferase family protein n=1 Tax=Microbulbifer sp. EKSA005 TaxID=3243364 RepID=UPI0040436F56